MRHTLFGLLVLIKFIGDTYFKDCTDIIFGTNAHEIVKTNTVLIPVMHLNSLQLTILMHL